MEKGGFCNVKQRSMSRNVKQMHDLKVKVSAFDYGGGGDLGERDLMAGGFSWPPRSYICSFCKREFRSAQALGGHMNVHRRDRARLRQSPTRDGGTSNNNNGGGAHFSTLNLNLEPNPSYYSNPSSSPSYYPSSPPTFLTKIPHFTSKLTPLGPPPARGGGGDGVRRPTTTDLTAKGNLGFEPSVRRKGCEGFKNPEFVRLDLEIGLMSPSEEELDLELRLGYT